MNPLDLGSDTSGENLSDSERELLSAAVTGALIDLRASDAALHDPAQGMTWDLSRQIPAALLTELLTTTQHGDSKAPRAVKLRGARITGSLDLEAATISCPLLLQDCYFDEMVNLDEATAPAIRMPGSHLPGLTGRQLHITGDLDLTGIIARAAFLLGARIGGQLHLSGASLSGVNGLALVAAGLRVDRDMYCREGFTANGEVHMIGARIGGQLNLDSASLSNPGGSAVVADGLTVDQGMHCAEGFTANGEVRMAGAHIAGQLILNGASLSNPGGTALGAESLAIGGDMFCRDGFTANGEVRLSGAHVGGQLGLGGARLRNQGSRALTADGLIVDQDMSCGEGFTANGEVRMLGAHINGQLNLNSASLSNPDGMAMLADALIVDREMFCGGTFTATGEVSLVGARIAGRLIFKGASLDNPGGTALDFEAANVTTLILLPRQQPNGAVNLSNARVGTFLDDSATWPPVIRLRGFTYDSLENSTITPRSRLRWLTRHPGGYAPQLYDQLAGAYRRSGDEQAARKIAVAKQWRRRRAFNPLNLLWYVTVGYGYRTWQAAIWLVALVVSSTWVFSGAYPAHMIASGSHPPAFQPFVYSLDLLLPVIGFGQKSAWQPQGPALLYWSWGLTGAGWVLTAAVVAGLTGVLKHD
jgi:hypothetical protein